MSVRECAWDSFRPWLARDLERARRLLDPVRSDPSDYVRRSVGNWLNDASKSRPEWVRSLAAEWRRASKTAETAWIVRHALRTLRKGGG